MDGSVRATLAATGGHTWLGPCDSDDRRSSDGGVVACGRKTRRNLDNGNHEDGTQLISESGNALLGFAVVAPIVTLLLIAVLSAASVVWQREIAAEFLRQATSRAARVGADPVACNKWFVERTHELGLRTTRAVWETLAIGTTSVLTARAQLSTDPTAITPNIQLQLYASAVQE